MTDHGPDDRNVSDLDRRIHDLVRRAVADTPPTPRLDEGVPLTPTNPTDQRNRWIIGGLVGLSVGAVIVAIFLFSRPDEVADPLVPATQSTVPVVTPPPPPTQPPPSTTPGTTAAATTASATTVPNETDPPQSTAPSTTPSTVPPTVPPTVPSTVATTTAPATTAPPTTTAPTGAPPAPERADTRLQAGPAGVEILGIDGRVVTAEPMALARLGPDGSVFMQRTLSVDADADGTETQLLVVSADSTAPVPVELAAPLDGPLRMHDSAAVDGRWTVLLESVPPTCPIPEDCIGGIYAYRPDTGEIAEVTSKIVFEGGWEQLSLSETGIVVGAETEGAARGPFIAAVPGATATPPTIAQLALDENYFDCSDCPQGYTISRRGDAVAWTEKNQDTGEMTVRVVGIDGTPVGEVSFADSGVDIAIPVVSLGAADVGGGNTTPIAIINEVSYVDRDAANLGPFAPIYVDIATGEVDLGPEGSRASYE